MSAAAAKSTTKTGIIWNIVCVVVCIIFIPFIICSIYLSIATKKDPDNLATIFGKTPVVVMSGSMSPTFYEDDLIFLEKVDIDSLQEEDIICFKDGTVFVTHRISRIVVVDGEKRFYTMGDYNGVEDKDYVVSEQIQGKYTGRIAKLGGVILFIQNPYGLVLTMILLLLLFITGELIIEILEKRKTNKRLLAEIEQLRLLIGTKEVVLAEKEKELVEQAQILLERDDANTEQQRQITEKDKFIALQQGTLAEKDAWIAEQEQLLTEREQRIAELEKQLIDQSEWLAAFQPRPEDLPPITETPTDNLAAVEEKPVEVVDEAIEEKPVEIADEVVEETPVEVVDEVVEEKPVEVESQGEVIAESVERQATTKSIRVIIPSKGKSFKVVAVKTNKGTSETPPKNTVIARLKAKVVPTSQIGMGAVLQRVSYVTTDENGKKVVVTEDFTKNYTKKP